MATKNEPVSVLGYIRVSTTDQAEHGQGLTIQRRAIREYCRAHRLRLLEILGDEGFSGASGLQGRPGLAEALRRIESHEASVLVLYRLDRLARDLLLQETVVERLRLGGGSVISVTEPDVDSNEPTRILVRQILGALAQYEKTLLKGRMAAGRKLKAARGGYTGGCRTKFGYTVVRREYEPLRAEQEIIARIRTERSGGATLQTIADGLNADGLTAKLGGTWRRWSVRRVVHQKP
jgi:site-specific DNA recombinase